MNYSEAVDYYMDDDGKLTERAEFHVRLGVGLIAEAVSKTAHAHGWWDSDVSSNDTAHGDRNMGEMIALMHSELSEALEAHRNNEPVLWYSYPGEFNQDEGWAMGVNNKPEHNGQLGKPEGIASEFADVIIRIFDTCKTLEIPIMQALLDKHAYNITRPYRHGGKSC